MAFLSISDRIGMHIASRYQSLLVRLREPALSAMLALQILIMFLAGPLQDTGVQDRWIVNVSPILLGILSLFLVSQRRTAGLIALFGFGLSGVGLALETTLPAGILAAGAATASGLLFSATICWAVGRIVFSDGRVTGHRIRGAIVIYLNIGLAFAFLDHLLYRFNPQAYAHMDAQHSLGQMLYFSLSALTCAGFGDIVGVHPLARSLATLESVTGQLYVSTFIAALVGLHASCRQRRLLTRRERNTL
jgi:ion channel